MNTEERRPVLFVDRDGTLIKEPEDEQIDSLEKLEFLPGVFSSLSYLLSEYDYELVMVTNQDGLGTPSYPKEQFDLVQDKLITAFRNEGINFDAVLIDTSTAAAPSENRKPSTGMVKAYLNDAFDLENSFVIGDRDSDLQLAANMGTNGILLRKDDEKVVGWKEVVEIIERKLGTVSKKRESKETKIQLEVQVPGTGDYKIDTGIPFFDHMLAQVAVHGGMNIFLETKGDLEVDEHHTIEDTAIMLGKAIGELAMKQRSMYRYGFMVPMDESLATVAIDFGGRPEIIWNAGFQREYVGKLPTEMVSHFFKSFAFAAGCNLYIEVTGENEHHKVEAIFKGFARALDLALRRDKARAYLPSSKGIIDKLDT